MHLMMALGIAQVSRNRMEFTAYELLYAALQGRWELNLALRSLSPGAWQHPYVQHSVKVGLCSAHQVMSLHEFCWL